MVASRQLLLLELKWLVRSAPTIFSFLYPPILHFNQQIFVATIANENSVPSKSTMHY
jgi:hypothetical protein